MSKPFKTGLFFGSFNPVHVGHMIIANYLLANSDLKEVWMVVSPHNPHKAKKSLAKDYDRLHLLNLAIGTNTRLKASDIEFTLPKPSYTIDTLTYAKEKYPDKTFVLIMGGDNLATLHKWKNYETILKYYEIYVYNRPGYEKSELSDHPKVTYMESPLLDISASYIRKQVKEGNSIQYLVPDKVFDYLNEVPIYKDI